MKKKQRLYFISFILASVAVAAALSLYALKDNISYFYSPMEIEGFRQSKPEAVAPRRRFRLGGLVKRGSLKKRGDSLKVYFIVTDEVNDTPVEYSGILPDLFREGQGVIATGSFNDQGTFIAGELLAKHDEKYMPPEVARSLEKAAKEKKNE